VAAVPPIPADAASDLLAGLVAIDSVNPGLVPGAAGEAAIVTFLRNRLEAAGFASAVGGPSGGGMHAVDEWVDLRQVRAYPRALMTAFRAFATAGYAD
jgi:acetylornithine deacetylase/succinyl-diaminopimelate desuccinylase-like protein